MKRTLTLLAALVFWTAPVVGQVDTAWVARYNGPGNLEDAATEIAVDGEGNVYVTGSSRGGVPSEDEDYATIKYYPNGDTAWVRRYDGPADGIDYAAALAVDDSGNVYVTGSSEGNVGIYSDYVTIKYNSNGDTVWLRRYNGEGNSRDMGRSIAVDAWRNVYVTGYSGTGTPSGQDYATIKYDSNGDTLWLRWYTGPGDPENTADVASGLVLDKNGSVYVTGYSPGVGTDYDFATIKYDGNGNSIWVRRYNYSGDSYEETQALAVDSSGNVYITGYTRGSTPNDDIITIKYNSNGDTVWVRRYNGPGNGGDWPYAIAVDNSGNTYVTGTSASDLVTIKYNSAGDTVWVRNYNGPGNSGDVGYSICVDGLGNVYVTGISEGSGTAQDYVTIKYNPNGDEDWVCRYNYSGSDYDQGSAIAVDDIGNVYVTGTSSHDYATIKYEQQNWVDVGVVYIESPPDTVLSSSAYYPVAIVENYIQFSLSFEVSCEIDSAGTTIYSDTVSVVDLDPDIALPVQFDLWTVPSIPDVANFIVTAKTLLDDIVPSNDSKSKIVFAHESNPPVMLEASADDGENPADGIDDDDFILVTFNEPTNKPVVNSANIDSVLHLSREHSWLDSLGRIGGAYWNTEGNTLLIDLSVFISPPTVAVGDTITLDGVTVKDSWGNPSSAQVVISGSFYVSVPINDNRVPLPAEFSLSQNSPNPFNPVTQIKFALPRDCWVKLEVYNILGQKVATLVDERQRAGYKTARWDAGSLSSGIYFYHLQVRNLVETKKMILLK